MFTHPRRSFNGRSLPTWLTQPGPVLMKNHLWHTKYDPIVQEVELIEANPDYAYVKFPDGRESSVPVRHLAPKGDSNVRLDEQPLNPPHLDSGAGSPKYSDPLENLSKDENQDTAVPELNNPDPHPVDSGKPSTLNTSLSGRQR